MTSINLTRDEAARRSELLAVDTYDVVLDLTDGAGGPGAERFRSTTTARFECREPGAETVIDLRGARLRSARLNGRELDVAGFDEERGLVLPDLAERNELVVDADCAYTTTGEGLHRMVDPVDGAVYLYTQFETADAKRVYACFDQPDLKAEHTLTVTAPADWTVVSTTFAETEPVEGGALRHRFAPTARLSTYLISVIAGPYGVVEDAYTDEHGSIPLRLLCRRSLLEHLDAERLFRETKEGFGFYHRAFGRPYPFGKYDQIFVPEFNAGAMENAGAVTFLEDYVFRSRVTGYRYERRNETILHEMAHMWFGDLVTMRWWDDLWLNESFATYASVLAQVEASEFREAWTTFAAVEKAWAYRQDQLPSTHPVAADMVDLETVDANFDGITYAKGASVLKQLVAYVGLEPFLAGLRAYFDEHAYGNAEFADLVGALEASSGRDLSDWAAQWLRTTGINPISVETETGEDGRLTRVTVVQGPATPGAGELRTHRLGVGLYGRGDSGEIKRYAYAEVDAESARTEIPELVGERAPELVVPNDSDLTYCSVRLDEASTAVALDRIEAVSDSLARTLCWSALWEATRKGTLPAREFVAVVARAGVHEQHISVLQKLLQQAHQALSRYAEPGWAAETGWPTFVAALLAAARSAARGSDQQLALVTALAAAPLTPESRELVEGVLAGGDALPGLAIDTDLRWTLLTALAAGGAADTARIDAELDTDRTASGERRAATARAALPTTEAKRAAVELLHRTGADAPSNAIVRATLLGLWNPGQEDALADAAAGYPERVTRLWRDRPGEVAQTVAEGAFPAWEITAESADRLSTFATDPATPTALGRIVAEQVDDLRRALRARATDTAAGRA